MKNKIQSRNNIIFIITLLFTSFSCSKDDNVKEDYKRFIGFAVLNSQADVYEFGQQGYNEVTGTLYIGSFNDNGQRYFPLSTLDTDITDLSPLNSIERIRGDFYILGNPLMTQLHGLENLKLVEGLTMAINLNESLTVISGLNNLESIGKVIYIGNNPALVNYCGLANLFETDLDLEYGISLNFNNPTPEEITNSVCY
jgi:hypothetical protein